MSALKEISNGQIKKAFDSCKSKVTLAINGASAATIKTTGAALIVIDGVYSSIAALSAQSFAVTHDLFGNPVGGVNAAAYVQPANTTVYYLVCLNAAGTVAVVQGTYLGQALSMPDKQRILTGTGNIPAIEPAGYVAIGAVKVATGAVTFTPGTTALDAASVTATYFDLERIPSSNP